MAGKEGIELRTEELLEPILKELQFQLWDVQYVKERDEWFLRVFIDKEGGIMIDDCVDVSRKLSDALDADDFIEDAYTLEVSSPGLGRKLVKDREYTLSIGRDVDIKFYKATDGQKEIRGKLEGFDAETVTVMTASGKAPPERKSFRRSDIATVKLSVDF